jgi:hypothetical protein
MLLYHHNSPVDNEATEPVVEARDTLKGELAADSKGELAVDSLQIATFGRMLHNL